MEKSGRRRRRRERILVKIGFVGLGKLGLPVALAISKQGHTVTGYDISDGRMEAATREGLTTGTLETVVDADIVFVAIQTPHEARYEGITRFPPERKDFDYTFLRSGLRALVAARRRASRKCVIAIISTILPGTTERELRPILEDVPFVYNPSFIAMGTVERDFLHPEFVLVGIDDQEAAAVVMQFYASLVDAPLYLTSVRNAELIKVAYNTFIGMKLVFANTMMELCHKTGCDVDVVTDALKMADKRLISPAYLSGGMGDGGACHPRDNIALSWLAKEIGLSFDLFEAVMTSREKQAEWIADLMCAYDLPKAILGLHYKPGTNILTGSHAMLVANILLERGEYISDTMPDDQPFVVLIGCKEPIFTEWPFPKGSIIIDPWRYIPERPGITVIGLGRSRDQAVSLVS